MEEEKEKNHTKVEEKESTIKPITEICKKNWKIEKI